MKYSDSCNKTQQLHQRSCTWHKGVEMEEEYINIFSLIVSLLNFKKKERSYFKIMNFSISYPVFEYTTS